MSSESHIIGIDLGTTNSVVAVVIGTEPEVITNSEGSNKTSSVVAFLESGEIVVGEIARRQASTNPQRTISSVKRLMGRSLEELEEDPEHFLYNLVSHDGEMLIDVDGMGYRPEQISALVLKKLKESAESYLNETVSRAVITVPAYFDDLQRQATIDAAEMAGLEVLRLINEPTAAAMAYGLGRSDDNEEIIAVYDWGGGTFDITLLEISGKTFEVLTSTGDSRLGGDDLDNAIVGLIVEEFFQRYQVDLTQDPVTVRRLKEVAERSKCELSSIAQTNLALPFIAYRDGQPLHLDRMLTRREFEDLIEEHVRRTIRCCKRALEDANMSKKDINRVIVVGGTTRIPMVEDAVEEFFDQAVFKGVNPDEVVALGAATQAGIFEGNVQEVVLLDITPHSLGIEVEGNRFSKIIDKNSTIPIKAAKTFTTTEENQQFVNIHVLQGESNDANDNRSLGKFSLTGLAPADPGVPRIRVTFFINADGVAEISAEDMSTGTSEQISIIHSQLTEEERTRRSRRRMRANRNRRFSGTGSRRGAGRRDATGTGTRERTAIEGRALGNRQGAITPLPIASQEAHEKTPSGTHQRFAVLGDTRPSDLEQGGVRSREAVPRSLEPVDYSKAPPMYSHMASKASAAHAATAIDPPGRQHAPISNLQDFQETRELPRPPSEAPSLDELILPREASAAIEAAEARKEDNRSMMSYASALQMLDLPPFSRSKAFGVTRARVLLHAMNGQLDESRDHLRALREHHLSNHGEEIVALHDLVFERFNSTAVLRERAQAKQRISDFAGACNDMELAMGHDPQETDAVVLEELYRQRSQQGDDPQGMFRLVKILLKKNGVDEAIEVLQELRTFTAYETRATKVLGLCHWQKNMHYLAWQSLKTLPVDDDMKDILYRLATDMETSDQLTNAVDVLDHLNTKSPGYRDTEARLRKLNYRLKLQREEEENSHSLPVLSRDSRFTILEEINRGSMGIIYKAKDRTLNEIVALKVLNDYLCSDPSAVERFKSEARAAKKLSHPYIVRIHDLFEVENKRFLSMEYITGRDLKRMISERTTFPEDQISYFCMQICDALSYAHKLGIVHRDIKPANIMITENNTVKITDFGIAKILRGDEATKSGTAVIGTPLYMAPEQIIGQDVDGRTDIYSLGIMMYEMVAGNPPFYLGNIEYHHIHTAPPQLPERASQRLREIVMKMIQKDPADRYQTIGEIMAELQQA